MDNLIEIDVICYICEEKLSDELGRSFFLGPDLEELKKGFAESEWVAYEKEALCQNCTKRYKL